MQMTAISLPEGPVLRWRETVFRAHAVDKGGIVRRAVDDVEREVGRQVFLAEVRRRQFHLVECGGQFIVFRNPGPVHVPC